MKLIIVFMLSLVAVSSVSIGGEPGDFSANAISSAHDFEFRVEMRENAVEFVSVHGTKWKELSWAIGDAGTMEFWLDESGVASRQEDLHGSRFLIHFRESESGAKMVSGGGTSWSELGFGCGEATVCKYMVDENGVQGL